MLKGIADPPRPLDMDGSSTGSSMDDELFKSAHEPAALWAKYFARRQARNPLYLRRTLSYCPEATRIGDAPAAPAVASPRYVKLRLAADLAAYPARAVADAGAARRPPRAAPRAGGRAPPQATSGCA